MIGDYNHSLCDYSNNFELNLKLNYYESKIYFTSRYTNNDNIY